MNTIEEEWRNVPGYETLIQVSNLGRVRSVQRRITFTDNKPSRVVGGKILVANLDRNGYPRLRLSLGLSKKSLRVHRLVALAFIPNIENKPQVNHINGNKSDNRLSNLEWSTNSENQNHALNIGLKSIPSGSNSIRFKGEIQVFDKNGIQVNSLYGNLDMASKGYDYRLVSACLTGKRKSHRGHTFQRMETL